MTESIALTQQVAAPPGEVYRYFTNPTYLREWLCDAATTQAVPGGRLYLGWHHGYGVAGNFTELVPGKRVVFTWVGPGDPGGSEVAVALAPEGAGTKVTLTHTFPGGEGWEEFARGARTWEDNLENLASVMATGHDLRFTRRPMLGLSVDAEVDADRAARLGIPEGHGVLLAGATEGMGAHAAGLRGGDTIVSIGGAPVRDFASIAVGLQGRRAGEQVEVVFYREGAQQRTTVTLSGRPLAEVPATAAALAAHVTDLYRWVDSEAAAAFVGSTEAQTTTRPAPGEWSAREVLAHMLDGEGDNHAYLAEVVQGAERSNDGPFENSHLRTTATADSYASTADMLASYRHLEAQTIAMLAALPDEFVARKGSFWRVAYSYTQARPHYEEHFVQIRAAIAAAAGR